MRNINDDSDQNGKEIFISNYLTIEKVPEKDGQLSLFAPKEKYLIQHNLSIWHKNSQTQCRWIQRI